MAWETFRDAAYFDMWCVRRVGEREFGRGFHLVNGDEAKALAELLAGNDRRREALRKILANAQQMSDGKQDYSGLWLCCAEEARAALSEQGGQVMDREPPCPRCGAYGDEECSTASGRDHPSRVNALLRWMKQRKAAAEQEGK